jgi:hypothetical protein
MRIFKKFLAVMITLTLSISCLPNSAVYAATVDRSQDKSVIDYYAEEKTESFNIEGIYYTYHYYYNEDGSKSINITNEQSKNIDTVSFDKSSSIIYLNEEKLATVETVYSYTKSIQAASDSWVPMGSSSNRITWAMGTTTAAVAAAIAIPLATYCGVAGVLSAMGLSALGVLAASAIGGTVKQSLYKFNSNLITQFRDDWSFTASTGDFYGTYTSLSPIY